MILNGLLAVNGVKKEFQQVYRRVRAAKSAVLSNKSVAVEEWGEDWQREASLARVAAK